MALAAVLSLSAAPAVRSETVQVPLDITSDALRAKVMAAIGSPGAWKAVVSLRSRGTLQITGLEGEGTVEEVSRTPNLAQVRTVLPSGEESLEGCDGRIAWEKDATGVRELKGAEKKEALLDCEFLAPFAMDRIYQEWKVSGKGAQKDLEFYLVDAVRRGGDKEVLTIDARTYLPIMAVAERTIEGQRLPLPVVLSDYRDVGGLKLPHLLRTKIGETTITVRLSSIEANVAIDDAAFAKPKS
jgi:hypothetical protein